MKKLLSLLLVFVLLFLIAACSSDNKKTEETVSETIEEPVTEIPAEEEEAEPEIVEEVKSIMPPMEFEMLVMDSSFIVLEDAMILMGYGEQEISVWKTSGDIAENISGEGENPGNIKILEEADKWLSENYERTRKELEDNYLKATEQHADIAGANIEDEKALNVREKYEALYSIYSELYLTVTNPSGTLESFTLKYAEIGNDFTDAMNDFVSSLE